MDPYPQWILCGLLLLFYALLSAGRTALTQLSDMQVKKMSASAIHRERLIAELLGHPSNLTDSLRLAELACAVLSAIFGYRTLWSAVWDGLILSRIQKNFYLFWADEPGWTIMAVFCLLHLVLCLVVLFVLDCICRRLTRRIAAWHPRPLALMLAPFCRAMSMLFLPSVRLHNAAANLLARPFAGHEDADPEQVTEEEIRLLVDVGNEKGEIEQSEKDMINNIFEFDERSVSEVMTHRTDMIALHADATLERTVETALESGYSRIPLYQDGVDKIIGILYIKDLLRLLGQDATGFSPRASMREVLFIPENMACADLFGLFQLKKIQIAVAVDEYGGTAGIVSMEDLLEAIVGNIQDEYDDEEEEIHPQVDGSYELDGALAISDVERLFDVSLDEENEDEYDTIGGLITHLLGGLPPVGEHPSVTLGGVCFTVMLVEERRVVRIHAAYTSTEIAGKTGASE